MLLDRAFRVTFRNFSTLFLLVATLILIPNLIYGWVFRTTFTLHDLHPFIEELRFGRQQSNIGSKDLDTWRTIGYLVTGLQVVIVMLLTGATNRVVAVDEEGGVPTVTGALRHPHASGLGLRWNLGEAATVLGGLAVGVVVAFLAARIGSMAVEPLPDEVNFAAFAAVTAASWGLGAPFFLSSVVAAGRSAAARADPLKPGQPPSDSSEAVEVSSTGLPPGAG